MDTGVMEVGMAEGIAVPSHRGSDPAPADDSVQQAQTATAIIDGMELDHPAPTIETREVVSAAASHTLNSHVVSPAPGTVTKAPAPATVHHVTMVTAATPTDTAPVVQHADLVDTAQETPYASSFDTKMEASDTAPAALAPTPLQEVTAVKADTSAPSDPVIGTEQHAGASSPQQPPPVPPSAAAEPAPTAEQIVATYAENHSAARQGVTDSDTSVQHDAHTANVAVLASADSAAGAKHPDTNTDAVISMDTDAMQQQGS